MTADNGTVRFERHLQTIIVMIVVALLLWVGATTQQTAIAVAKLSVDVNYLQAEIKKPDSKFDEIEQRLDRIERSLLQHNASGHDKD